jgi:hypothetical protein
MIKVDPWADYAQELKDRDRETEEKYAKLWGWPVDTEVQGWTATQRYRDWMAPSKRRANGADDDAGMA